MPLVITEVSEESVKFYMMFSYLRDLLENICILHYMVHIKSPLWEKKITNYWFYNQNTIWEVFTFLKSLLYIVLIICKYLEKFCQVHDHEGEKKAQS